MGNCGKEIERKFLVDKRLWSRPADGGLVCKQGYIFSDGDKLLRVRIIGDAAYLTIKAKGQGITRIEYEYQIPVEDAAVMLNKFCGGAIVEKIRYEFNFADMNWCVDVFAGDNDGLILAEVELDDENQQFERPTWIAEEVTEDPRYLNVNLVKKKK